MEVLSVTSHRSPLNRPAFLSTHTDTRSGQTNMAAGCERILHQSVLELDHKQVNVTLTSKYIAIEHHNKARHGDSGLLDTKPSKHDAPVQCQVIPLEEVITVQPHHLGSGKDRFKIHKGGAVYQAVEMQPQLPTAFDVYIVKRAPKHRWRERTLTLTCKDHATCTQWMDMIKDVLSGPGFNRPKQLLVFVNPYGGKKRAPKVFEKVRYLFDLAGVSLDVIETQRQYHARDVLQTYDVSSVDGVVCVGGDGTFSEVLNGVLDRCQTDERVSQSFRHQPARPRLRIGVIPAGSTDSVVCSTTGTNDPITSTLHIILGCSVGVDVNALYKEKVFVKYSVTMTSYGYYGDLLADSERLRWMGPKRYNWSGFKKFVLNKSYEGEVSFVPADKNSGHPQDGNVCYTGCVVCQRAGREAEIASKERPTTAGPMFDLGAGHEEKEEEQLMDSWPKVSGKFIAINAVSVSCRCGLSPEGMSPFTHLGDGCIDLILVMACSRLNYLRHLVRIPNHNSNQFDFSFVQVFRVKEFEFQPAYDPEERGEGTVGREVEVEHSPDPYKLGMGPSAPSLSRGSSQVSGSSRVSGSSQVSRGSGNQLMKHSPSQNSVWNCDGEVLEHPNLHIQVHCQLISMFARGVEDHSKREVDTCPVCCNPCSHC
ncbi:ceramide kinase-like isoform X2 [Babylonia areolata]|uniref:ceramide kinase-like isoform X2 n=1 Tax=Babylonia areolata TaxID=304850 RepID=UPI003FD52F7E